MSALGQATSVEPTVYLEDETSFRSKDKHFRELARRVHRLDRTAMCFDDDIVTYGDQGRSFTRWLGRKEGIEHFLFDVR
jgi:hypothetical protein